ncbi:hypothetical protein RhiXN_00080 [Rhizoctonia solani]|uniref:Uncharacterized protein n=1 Tax=Rhizoctonia solani TaxID=456999 RepID=A0A8H8SUW5_9AGAM|nr:uncharacterized protein RhiXN_00080 [Rhizoctonia solani]QRW18674.1 hypothetical protein RhiXN_00080 [Rhizoctonia solani]
MLLDKQLHFYARGVQNDTTVMLAFEPRQSSKLYEDYFPVVWKVFTFRKQGHPKKTVRYTPRVAFAYAQADHNSLVECAGWVEIRDDINNGTSPMGRNNASGPGTMRAYCKNGSKRRADLSIGLLKGDRIINIMSQYVYGLVSISAYVTRDYKVNEMIHRKVEADAIWTQNLDQIDDITGWNLTEDPITGKFSIERTSTW